MKNKVYDYVKYTTTVAIPALSAAYVGMDVALDGALPYENQVAKAAVVITTLLGALVLQQSHSYNNSDDRFDGAIEVNSNDPSILHSLDLDGIAPKELGQRDQVLLKVTKNDAELPPPDLD
jgi:hypothetical protein